jgi:hypothetical protein
MKTAAVPSWRFFLVVSYVWNFVCFSKRTDSGKYFNGDISSWFLYVAMQDELKTARCAVLLTTSP